MTPPPSATLRALPLLAAIALVPLAGTTTGCGATPEPDETPSGTEDADSDDAALEGGASFTQTATSVTFTNGDGDWTIFKECVGPSKRGGQDVTVGPGYIARVVLKKNTPTGHTILNDEAPAHDAGGNTVGFTHPGFAGLGGFAWHHSRGHAPFVLGFNNAWDIAGRVCAEDHGGFGVSGAKVVDGPRLSSRGVGILAVDVSFSDGWTTNAPLLTVRYVYRVYGNVVKMWAVVTEHCPNGVCGAGAPGEAFIGEPKFVSAVSGGGYRRMAMFNDEGKVATNSFSSQASCLWMGAHPQKATGQCDGDHRVRARFDYGTMNSGADGGCDATKHLCLNTVMQSYPVDPDGGVSPGKKRHFWEKSGLGLDHWALLSDARQRANANDSPAGGALWSCHGGSTAAQVNRRWELVGLDKDAQDRFTNAAFYFHGWESGTGSYDCEPLSRRFGPDGEAFAVAAQYSINDGWSIE